MIECRGLMKRFGTQEVVSNLDLDVARGELLVLIGASGSGKTTTLKMINRLIEPTAGSIRIDGRAVDAVEPHILRRGIGYGAQRAGLFPHMTVAENVGITPRLLGWDADRIARRVDELLARVRLDAVADRERSVENLSGGEQQRVSLARALAAEPEVLLLDEPFGAVDPVTRDALQEALAALKQELGLTIVFVTHDMSEALLLGDRIAFLAEGRIARIGTPDELLANPGHPRVAEFLRAPTRQAERIARLAGGAGTAPAGGEPSA